MSADKTDPIYLSSDHAGIELREIIAGHLSHSGYKVDDLGPSKGESVDYPDYGDKLARVLKDVPGGRGIAICGSGIGISMALNRFNWVRAALVGDAGSARLGREHNDANVLVLGQRVIESMVALECVDVFLSTAFEGGRHQRRVGQAWRPGEWRGRARTTQLVAGRAPAEHWRQNQWTR